MKTPQILKSPSSDVAGVVYRWQVLKLLYGLADENAVGDQEQPDRHSRKCPGLIALWVKGTRSKAVDDARHEKRQRCNKDPPTPAGQTATITNTLAQPSGRCLDGGGDEHGDNECGSGVVHLRVVERPGTNGSSKTEDDVENKTERCKGGSTEAETTFHRRVIVICTLTRHTSIN